MLTWQHHISYVFNKKRLLLLIAVKCNNNSNDNSNNNNDSIVVLMNCDLSSYNYYYVVFLPILFIRVTGEITWKSSCPKKCCLKPELCCLKFVYNSQFRILGNMYIFYVTEILNYVGWNFSQRKIHREIEWNKAV